MSINHEIRISNTEPEPLTAPKFWSINSRDELDFKDSFVGKTITFRGRHWKVDMVCQQTSTPGHLAGVKKHPEKELAELIASEWGAHRVRVWQGDVVGRDELRGPLTKDEASDAELFFVEEVDADPWLKIVHPTRGTFRQNFSIVMPGGEHQAAYGRDAGCIAIKLAELVS